ncbi:MAG: pilus assembly protein [Pirellula sp.]|nr:pilus assembly protein [Pirellula sp.]
MLNRNWILALTQPFTSRSRCRRSKTRSKRNGAAVVELAVCMPVVVLVVFASLEGANMLFVRQATVQAAYEAAKFGSRRDGTRVQAERLATEVLTARRINSPTITFVTGDPASTRSGSDVTVRVSVNSNDRLITGFRIFSGRQIEAIATMQKE